MKMYYFTGTGISFWTAKKIENYFNTDVYSMTDFKNAYPIVEDSDVIGIGFPT